MLCIKANLPSAMFCIVASFFSGRAKQGGGMAKTMCSGFKPQFHYIRTSRRAQNEMNKIRIKPCLIGFMLNLENWVVWLRISMTGSNSSNRRPHRVTPGQLNSGQKQIHISKLFSHIYQPSVKSIYKTKCKHKTYLQKCQDTNFRRVIPSIVPPLKECIRPGHGSTEHHQCM